MSFEHFCFRFIQTTFHILWFAAPFLGLFWSITVGDQYRRRGDTENAVFFEVLGFFVLFISYGTLIFGYLQGWNVR